MRYASTFLLAAVSFLTLHCAPTVFCGEDDGHDDIDVIPEGFEERQYPIRDLLSGIPELDRLDGPTGSMPSACQLAPDHIMSIIRHAAGPDTWTKRGAARMSVQSWMLVVLQKKEVHDEIAKVLAWLREATVIHSRTTLVLAALKPEALAKLENGNGQITSADLFKAIEDAGEGSATILELRGREGQDVVATGSLRQKRTMDYDVSGGVLDPVMRSQAVGVIANARVFRLPDCKNARVDLGMRVQGSISEAEAEIRLRGIGTREVTSIQKINQSDKPEKKDEVREERHAGALRPVEFDSLLKVDASRQALGNLQATVVAPRGQFVLAGVLDYAAGDGKENVRRAVLVRAEAGTGSVPTLLGVSGLKEGEIFKIYPLAVAMTEVADFPAPRWSDPELETKVALGGGLVDYQIGVANPFSIAPTGAPALVTLNTEMIQSKFAERVRKNKLVEPYGHVIFTRLNAEDHAKMQSTVSTPVQAALEGIRVRTVAVALSQSAWRKLLLDDADKIDDAALQALLATPQAVRLADASLVVQPNQTTHSFAGKGVRFISDYEISGDLHDPVRSGLLERGYVLEAHHVPPVSPTSAQVAVRFRLYPGAKIENKPIDTYAMGSGMKSDFLMRITADLAHVRLGIVNLQGNVRATKGQYVIACSTPMPATAEGAADSRQAVLLVRVEDSSKP